MSDDLYQQPYRCEGCAFVSGTEANRHEHTQLLIKLCLEAREPFFCHEVVQELHQCGLPYSEAIREAEAIGAMPVCKGYVDALAMLIDKGYYDKQPQWKQELAIRSMDLMDKARDGQIPKDEIESGQAVRTIVAELLAEQARE